MKNIKRIITKIVQLLTRIFCISKINHKKIVFEAYMGKQYSCNPKYLCRYIEEHDKSFQIIWVYYKNRLPCTYEQVKRNSIPYFYHMLTAGTVIINSGKNNLLRLRKEQIQINTWHGGGAYKRLDSNLLHEKYLLLSNCSG